MSEQAPSSESIFRRILEPPAINYLIMAGLGLMLHTFVLFGEGNDMAALISILLAIPGILARWTASPVLILLVTIYVKIDPGMMRIVAFFTRGRSFFPEPGIGFVLEDLLLCMGYLAYAIGHFRLISIVHQLMPDDPTLQDPVEPRNPPRRPANLVPVNEWQQLLIAGVTCLAIGQMAWWLLVSVERAMRPHPSGFSGGTSRMLLLIWVSGISLVIVSAGLIYLRSYRMSRAEAALSLRDEFMLEHMRETDRLMRWKHWDRNRIARLRQK